MASEDSTVLVFVSFAHSRSFLCLLIPHHACIVFIKVLVLVFTVNPRPLFRSHLLCFAFHQLLRVFVFVPSQQLVNVIFVLDDLKPVFGVVLAFKGLPVGHISSGVRVW